MLFSLVLLEKKEKEKQKEERWPLDIRPRSKPL